MLFDTHCHLNFSAFEGRVSEVIKRANEVGVNYVVVPGTDFETSEKAVEIASSFPNIYAAVGIHPHHIFEMLQKKEKPEIKNELKKIEDLLINKNVVAVGEVGMDRHIYGKTKYQNYQIDQQFIDLQKQFLKEQIKLAVKYKKSLIFHNREAKRDFLEVISEFTAVLAGKAVFHCCEPDTELLDFARSHKFFIGVDGDIIYRADKQEFVKNIPLEMLVLETDSPFLAPDRKFPNEPAQISFIAEFIADILNVPKEELGKITTQNAKRLFSLPRL